MKIHMIAADERTPVIFSLSAGQAHDGPEGRKLPERLGSSQLLEGDFRRLRSTSPFRVNCEVNASFGEILEITRSTKSGALRRSRGTATTPALMQPKKISTHCGQFGPQTMT